MLKHKIGDHVRMRDDLVPGNIYGAREYTDDMSIYAGSELEIVGTCSDGAGYWVRGDEECSVCSVSDEMLEGTSDVEYAYRLWLHMRERAAQSVIRIIESYMRQADGTSKEINAIDSAVWASNNLLTELAIELGLDEKHGKLLDTYDMLDDAAREMFGMGFDAANEYMKKQREDHEYEYEYEYEYE